MQPPLRISLADARRLAVSRQYLDGPRREADKENLRSVLRSLRFLQLDPVKVVAPSHHLVLWSRLGPGADSFLDELLWDQRWLFEYWTHAAAIVLTEDYPIHRVTMNAYPPYRGIAAWMDANEQLRKHLFHRLEEAGPLPTSGFEDCAVVDWQSTGWTAGRNVERMLQFLWLGGQVMVAGRAGGQRLWGLPDTCLPPDVDRTPVPAREAVALVTEHALRALGVARETDVKQYLFRNQSTRLGEALQTLSKRGKIVPAQVDGDPASSDPWFVHVDALDRLEAIRAGDWQPRTTLLSPFDNLINDRIRTRHLWRFTFRNEMYIPKAKRQYGYYLLPILHGEQLVGRVSLRVDRRPKLLQVEGLYLETGVQPTTALLQAVTGQLDDLAAFAGATDVAYSDVVPDRWRGKLHR